MTEHATIEEAFGMTSKELARKVCDLRYDEVERFFRDLSQAVVEDSLRDRHHGRPLLAQLLQNLATQIHMTALRAQIVWKLCKKY